MKYIIAAVLLLPLLTRGQVIRVCKDSTVTHDSTVTVKMIGSESVTHDSMFCRVNWFGRLRCKAKPTTHDSIISTDLQMTVSAVHDSTVCKDSTLAKVYVGVMINQQGSTTLYDKATAVKDSLHCTYAREGIDLSSWKGKSSVLEDYRAKGVMVFLNVTFSSQATEPRNYPTPSEIATCMINLRQLLLLYRDVIAGIFGPNEPFNKHYWLSPDNRTDYNSFMIALAQTCADYGIPVMDGGLFNTNMEVLAWRDLTRSGKTADALLLEPSMTTKSLKQAQNPKFDLTFEAEIQADSSTMAIDKASGAKWVCMHIYYDSDKVEQHISQVKASVHYIKQYVLKMTGLTLFVGETGTRHCVKGVSDTTTSPVAVVNLMQVFYDERVSGIYFSGNHGSSCSLGLLYDSGKLNNAGRAFRDLIDNHEQ